MYVVEQDDNGILHTDDVLRALSFYNRTPSGCDTSGGTPTHLPDLSEE
jgi:hypothetical protein